MGDFCATYRYFLQECATTPYLKRLIVTPWIYLFQHLRFDLPMKISIS
jgi:hypothetical protein